MNLVVDASVYISALGIEDEYTPDSHLFFRTAQKRQEIFFLPTLVIVETLTILRKQNHPDITSVSNTLMDMRIIPLDIAYIKQFTTFLLHQLVKLKTSDLIITVTATVYKATLITWDKRLLAANDILCPVMTPADYLSTLSISS